MRPPSASISRTRCPLAVPPMAGLHGMCATVSRDSVQSPTWQPIRAAAYAASTPAWPAPITMTSNRMSHAHLFPDAERREDVMQHVVRGAYAHDFVESSACGLQVGEHELLGDVTVTQRVDDT